MPGVDLLIDDIDEVEPGAGAKTGTKPPDPEADRALEAGDAEDDRRRDPHLWAAPCGWWRRPRRCGCAAVELMVTDGPLQRGSRHPPRRDRHV